MFDREATLFCGFKGRSGFYVGNRLMGSKVEAGSPVRRLLQKPRGSSPSAAVAKVVQLRMYFEGRVIKIC